MEFSLALPMEFIIALRAVRPPYKSINDIFCLRAERMVNSYRKVSINNLELKVPGAPLHDLSACGNTQAESF